MITDTIIQMILGVANNLLSVLPEVTFDTESLGGASYSLGSVWMAGNGWFPLDLTFICLGVVVGYQIALLAWRLVVFIWELLPLT